MFSNEQLEAINTKRRSNGKRPINSGILNQNPSFPPGVNAEQFWLDYKMPGDVDPEPGKPITEYADPARDAFGVDGKNRQPDAKPVDLEDKDDENEAGDDDDYNEMTIDELKTEAEKRGLDTSGAKLKADWVKLLEDDDEK